MTDIRKLTTGYVAAFNARDIDQVAKYLADGFELSDPEVSALTPKNSVVDYINHLFTSHEFLSFDAHSIFVDGSVSVIHFTLTLDKQMLDGVDVISWNSGKMIAMHAYLTKRS
jgi:ketosteroid isomerase-like protein